MVFTAGIWADEPVWRSKEYSHLAQEESIAQVLRDFASDQGLAIVLSEKITGKVSGKFGPVSPREFLDSFTKSNGLVWFFDGQALQISRGDELLADFLPLKTTTADRLAAVVKTVGAFGERCQIKPAGEPGLVYVAGPAKYLQLVKTIADALDAVQKERRTSDLSVQVFPLRYAWADDQTVIFRETEIVIPGVANVLRNLVGIAPTSSAGRGGKSVRRLPSTLQGLRGSGLSSVGRAFTAGQAAATANNPPAAPQNSAGNQTQNNSDDPMPTIQSDPRLNAIIVQDLPSRMPAYESLIRSLDRPTGLVEIEATIVDVNADRARELGLPLNLAWDKDGNLHQLGFSISPTDIPNLTFTLLRAGKTQFLSQLKALSTCGQARIVSRPSVLTLDNIEAQLESTETFFVRIPGQFEVDLFNVTVGTSLRVTPHIVDDNGHRQVTLQVRIEDGVQKEQTVDNIPVISRNSINTQAVLGEQESMLIGGLTRDEKRRQVKGVPYLMNVPVVGAVFRTVSESSQRLERYVLLTPRIVDGQVLAAGESCHLATPNAPAIMPTVPNPTTRAISPMPEPSKTSTESVAPQQIPKLALNLKPYEFRSARENPTEESPKPIAASRSTAPLDSIAMPSVAEESSTNRNSFRSAATVPQTVISKREKPRPTLLSTMESAAPESAIDPRTSQKSSRPERKPRLETNEEHSVDRLPVPERIADESGFILKPYRPKANTRNDGLKSTGIAGPAENSSPSAGENSAGWRKSPTPRPESDSR